MIRLVSVSCYSYCCFSFIFLWTICATCCCTSTNAFVVIAPRTCHTPIRHPLLEPPPKQRQTRPTTNRPPVLITVSSSSTTTALCLSAEKDEVTASNDDEQSQQPAGVLDAPEGVEPGSSEELMYTLGVNLARQLGDVRPLVENGRELAQVAKGLLDTVIGRLSEEGQRQLLQRRGAELNQIITDRANKIKESLAQAGREMLEQMAQAEGAVQLPSGVVLHVLEHGPDGPGRGVRPTRASTVKIHYHGTLADGTVFDSTLSGEPVQFPLGGVIPGWRDGVLQMHEGETAMLGIPPAQGYGDRGTPDGSIPGDSTLFFKIQLLQVMSAGIGGEPTLLGADGRKMEKKKAGDTSSGSSGLLGADGRPLV